MIRPARRLSKPDLRRALQLLAASADGYTGESERVVVGSSTIEVARVRITDAGRQVLNGAKP